MQTRSLNFEWRGILLTALSGMLFGCMGFLGTKIIDLHISVETMLFWRFMVATLCMLVIKLITKTQALSMDFKLLFKIFIFSAISYSGASFFYFLASQQIGTGLAMVIFFSFPIFVALFATALGTWKINKIAGLALIAVVLGLFLLKGNDHSTIAGLGILLGMIAACSFAMYVYGSQHTVKNLDTNTLTLLVCAGNSLIFLIFSCYTHHFVLPNNINAWLYIIAIGIIATALPIQLLLQGLQYISPLKASILSVLEPIVTVLIGLTMLHETLSLVQSFGIIIILFGAILIQFESKQG